MIETIRIAFHSIGDKFTGKLTEVVGWSVTGTVAIVTGLSIIDIINGILQTIALVITIAGGIATYRY